MKTLMIAILLVSSSAFAQLSATGKVTVYPMQATPATMVIAIEGKAAGALYLSLTVEDTVIENSSKQFVSQRISKNITCTKLQNKKTYKESYLCELSIEDGAVGAGAAG